MEANSQPNLDDRSAAHPPHAIITGGSSGIGKAVAQQLARQGFSLSLIARTESKLQNAKAELSNQLVSSSQAVLTFAADVADRSQIESAIQRSIQALGAPSLLITCAGIARPGYFQEIPIEVFERTMQVNYFGSLYCIRSALPSMARSSRIVLISSGAGLIGLYGYTPYSPSKFALRGLAESLRGELKPKGIGVSIVYPPDTDTPQLAEENKTKPPETKQITATAETWTADGVATEILKGIQKNSFVIAPGTEMTVLARLHSLLAPGLNWYFDRIVAKLAQ